MGRIPESEIERLKSEVSVQRLAESAGIKLALPSRAAAADVRIPPGR